jgi:alpha-ketoglutarate-dependent taurine dioxygenase
MLGRPVAQKWCDGKMLYSVTDLGEPSGNGVRPDVTNEEQSFHTDNSYNICPPDVVGLLCLQPSMSGGLSRVVNMKSVLEKMEISHKTLVQRLYRPFVFDRQKEHSGWDPETLQNPILSSNGEDLRIRVSRNLIYQGYALRDERIDDAGEEALAAFFDIIDDPEMYKEFKFEAGQIQFLNNRVIGHKRTKFEDWPNTRKKRHLCRVWLRDHGRVFYNG